MALGCSSVVLTSTLSGLAPGAVSSKVTESQSKKRSATAPFFQLVLEGVEVAQEGLTEPVQTRLGGAPVPTTSLSTPGVAVSSVRPCRTAGICRFEGEPPRLPA